MNIYYPNEYLQKKRREEFKIIIDRYLLEMEVDGTIIELDQEERSENRERQVRPEVRGQGSTTRCSATNGG